MATFCFASADDRRALFCEAAARGYLAAIRDFPHYKSESETWEAARAVCESLRAEVCCILALGERVYSELVMAGWANFYQCLAHLSERELIALGIADIKRGPVEEALAIARKRFAEDETVLGIVGAAYAEYLAAVTMMQ